MNSCLTNYIKSKFTSIGGNKWRAASGNIYYYEGKFTFFNMSSLFSYILFRKSLGYYIYGINGFIFSINLARIELK